MNHHRPPAATPTCSPHPTPRQEELIDHLRRVRPLELLRRHEWRQTVWLVSVEHLYVCSLRAAQLTDIIREAIDAGEIQAFCPVCGARARTHGNGLAHRPSCQTHAPELPPEEAAALARLLASSFHIWAPRSATGTGDLFAADDDHDRWLPFSAVPVGWPRRPARRYVEITGDHKLHPTHWTVRSPTNYAAQPIALVDAIYLALTKTVTWDGRNARWRYADDIPQELRTAVRQARATVNTSGRVNPAILQQHQRYLSSETDAVNHGTRENRGR
jgi:hypothetical protein